MDHAGTAASWSDWPAAKRSDAIRTDLENLGLPMPDPVEVPAFGGEAEIFGMLYVLEGSRLGGKVQSRLIANDAPSAFLLHSSPLPWKKFISLLEQKLASPVDCALAQRAANDAFGCFAAAARRFLGA
ncbi:biliverdin-producing heme oxygenase [Sphingomicrobium sediminis]|uniref:Biliverdin-producing heme oxygenase n=1 Tax=Sphingomicrobium sediminis TaxID=2950949 RepID=A0A9X2J1H1_9SPHN|nr:biliverdin-producing heme oxygenase [Sphingomicrobium sediminis]MCM8557258.1 biliverdin-producing heme oxygenase [Sphingomicrobium sediminis]